MQKLIVFAFALSGWVALWWFVKLSDERERAGDEGLDTYSIR